jgi:hypothetical protein
VGSGEHSLSKGLVSHPELNQVFPKDYIHGVHRVPKSLLALLGQVNVLLNLPGPLHIDLGGLQVHHQHRYAAQL